MARMLGKSFRVRGCPYGCCVPDWSPRRRSLIVRRARAIEKRAWKKDARRLLAGSAT